MVNKSWFTHQHNKLKFLWEAVQIDNTKTNLQVFSYQLLYQLSKRMQTPPLLINNGETFDVL